MKSYIIITGRMLLFCLICFTACKKEWDAYEDKDYVAFTESSFKVTQTLPAIESALNTDSMIIGGPMIIVDNYLVIIDESGKAPLHIYNLESNETFYRGKFGRGPSEVIAPWALLPVSAKEFSLYDITQRKIVNYHIDSLVEQQAYLSEGKMLPEKLIESPYVYDDKIFFLYPLEGSNRFYSIDRNSSEEKAYGTLLRKRNRNILDEVHNQVCQAYLKVHNNKVFVAYRLAPFFEIYDLSTGEQKAFRGPHDFNPIYTDAEQDGKPHFAVNYNTLATFRDLFVSEEFFYLLYSGELLINDSGVSSGSHLFKLSHEGELITHYKLEKDIMTFTVFEDSVIYGVHNDLTTEIVKYTL